MGGVLATGLLIVGANLRRLWRALQRRVIASRPDTAPRLAASIWYQRMTRTLARRGWRKLPGQTPAEFVLRIAHPGLQTRVAEFTRSYEEARFGDSPAGALRLPVLYKEIAQAANTRP